mgnify:CR=1 FL=1
MDMDFGHSKNQHWKLQKYRLNEADRAKVNKMLSYYIGTHKYHNFTQGKRPDDMSCQRYMMSFTCSKPFLIHGIEFVQLHVVGQSFMIYQIRKMVGLIVHLMRWKLSRTYGSKYHSSPIRSMRTAMA